MPLAQISIHRHNSKLNWKRKAFWVDPEIQVSRADEPGTAHLWSQPPLSPVPVCPGLYMGLSVWTMRMLSVFLTTTAISSLNVCVRPFIWTDRKATSLGDEVLGSWEQNKSKEPSSSCLSISLLPICLSLLRTVGEPQHFIYLFTYLFSMNII